MVGDPADDGATEEDPPFAKRSPSAAAVRVVGFTRSTVASVAAGSDSSTAFGSAVASSALAVTVTSLVCVAVSVEICWIPVAVSVDLSCSVSVGSSVDVTPARQASASPASVAVVASAGSAVAAAIGAELAQQWWRADESPSVVDTLSDCVDQIGGHRRGLELRTSSRARVGSPGGMVRS